MLEKLKGLVGRRRENKKIRDGLFIGSGLPDVDMRELKKGTHDLVDPFFNTLPPEILERLRMKFRNFGFFPEEAKAFLKKQKAEGITYKEIRMYAPYTGIIDVDSEFEGLCRLMWATLVDGGRVLILTDMKPDAKGFAYKYKGADSEGFYEMLKGKALSDISESKKREIQENTKVVETVNMVESLKKAGFDVQFSITSDEKLISRSETTMKRYQKGNPIFLVSAKKLT
jgi:hypothetical protein